MGRGFESLLRYHLAEQAASLRSLNAVVACEGY